MRLTSMVKHALSGMWSGGDSGFQLANHRNMTGIPLPGPNLSYQPVCSPYVIYAPDVVGILDVNNINGAVFKYDLETPTTLPAADDNATGPVSTSTHGELISPHD